MQINTAITIEHRGFGFQKSFAIVIQLKFIQLELYLKTMLKLALSAKVGTKHGKDIILVLQIV